MRHGDAGAEIRRVETHQLEEPVVAEAGRDPLQEGHVRNDAGEPAQRVDLRDDGSTDAPIRGSRL